MIVAFCAFNQTASTEYFMLALIGYGEVLLYK